MIAGYMGKSDVFDKLVATLSRVYADQGELDYAAFEKAIRAGRIAIAARSC
jgi:hypothetical protein